MLIVTLLNKKILYNKKEKGVKEPDNYAKRKFALQLL